MFCRLIHIFILILALASVPYSRFPPGFRTPTKHNFFSDCRKIAQNSGQQYSTPVCPLHSQLHRRRKILTVYVHLSLSKGSSRNLRLYDRPLLIRIQKQAAIQTLCHYKCFSQSFAEFCRHNQSALGIYGMIVFTLKSASHWKHLPSVLSKRCFGYPQSYPLYPLSTLLHHFHPLLYK